MAERLQLKPFDCPVITVGGTNGKGSCVAYLETILTAQGYRACAYTSPHLLRYNERIRIAGREANDEELCSAFERVEAARADVPLTYFEFGTLAALVIFHDSHPQAVILEVGLGGRLDAVNLVDADVALVSSIGIDHTEWLGMDRERIGHEKAGIFRLKRLAVCGDPAPPESLLRHAGMLDIRLYRLGQEFWVDSGPNSWTWRGWDENLMDLPLPTPNCEAQRFNAASSIASLKLLQDKLPVAIGAIRQGLRQVQLQGRFQRLPGKVPVMLDVAHNAEAWVVLASNLKAQTCMGRTLAVLGVLRDKPVSELAHIMDDCVHAWYLGGLQVSGRGQNADQLAQRLGLLSGDLSCYPDIPAAFNAACGAAQSGDRVIVFGSFHTVEAILRIAT